LQYPGFRSNISAVRCDIIEDGKLVLAESRGAKEKPWQLKRGNDKKSVFPLQLPEISPGVVLVG
jgi:hypothetical protein